MDENKIRELRKKHGITQRQLADAVGTSQQQIQRIESGVQAARFDLAIRICSALGEEMEVVFPATRKAIRAAKRSGEKVVTYQNEKLSKGLTEAGLDMSYEVHTVKLLLRGGGVVLHRVSGREKERLWGAVQRVEGYDHFVVYDTEDRRVALNLDHLIFAHFLFDAPAFLPEVESSECVEVYTAVIKDPVVLSVDPDQVEMDVEDDAHWEEVQLQHLFFIAEMAVGDADEIAMLSDSDGETAVFRLNDVAMISAPLQLAEPKLFEAEMDGFREDEGLRAEGDKE